MRLGEHGEMVDADFVDYRDEDCPVRCVTVMFSGSIIAVPIERPPRWDAVWIPGISYLPSHFPTLTGQVKEATRKEN
jgi:hypothetical protein